MSEPPCSPPWQGGLGQELAPYQGEDPREVEWIRVARADDVPRDGGVTVRHGNLQIAVFNFTTRGTWYATQAMCPHRGDMVLGRGLLGTQGDEPKVACPMHKKTFSLESGAGLADPQYRIETYAVEVRDGDVYVAVPSATAAVAASTCGAAVCPGAHVGLAAAGPA